MNGHMAASVSPRKVNGIFWKARVDVDASSPKGRIVFRPLDTWRSASTIKLSNVPSSSVGAVKSRTQFSLACCSASAPSPALTQSFRGSDAGAKIWLLDTR